MMTKIHNLVTEIDNIYIIGLGLPRTGGTSLAVALRALGYYGLNSCILTNVTTTTVPRNPNIGPNNKRFLIDNAMASNFMEYSFAEFLQEYEIQYGATKFILTTRDEFEWRQSLAKFDMKPKSGTMIPNKVEYEDKIVESIAPEKLLVLNLSTCKKKCYAKLCEFLGEPVIEDADFPCENC